MAKITKSRAYGAENVAKYLIYLASRAIAGDDARQREGLSNLKLQKLLYFAQAYYLAKLDHPLFREKIEAWAYGPVVPAIYHQYKRYGNDPVISETDESTLTDQDKEILSKFFDNFGGYSAGRLIDISHSHQPWKDANVTRSKLISQATLKKYYSPLLK